MAGKLKKALINAAVALLTICTGLLLTEGMLRIIVPLEVRYETWFTPGIHSYDAELGFICTPGYSGLMRHLHKVYRGVPLELNELGMRLENTSPGAAESYKRIVALGGRSMMMSYGLEDEATITGALAKKLEEPVRIQNTAWAGWGLWMNWLSYRRLLDGKAHFDLAIIAIYEEDYPSFEPWTTYEWNWPQPPEEEMFAQLEGIRLWPTGLVEKFGKWSYRSYVLYGVLRAIDRLLAEPWEPPTISPDTPTGGFVRYLTFIRDHFAEQGTQSLFVFLPQRDRPEDLYDVLARGMPSDFYWVDLHRELHGEMDELGWIGGHHYSKAAADRVAGAMEPHVRAALQEREQ